MLADVLAGLLLLSLAGHALAQWSGPGGPCDGTTGLICGGGTRCVDRRGRMQFQLFGDGAGAPDGRLRCATLVSEGEACGVERNVLCASILAEQRPLDGSPRGPTVPGICEGGLCVRGKVGLKGDWCAPRLGVRCLGDGEAGACDEDRLFCEFVRGYPEDGHHCVTKGIEVGAACNTGLSRTVGHTKVFERCEAGATCTSVSGEALIEKGICAKQA
jgi:hypothetical protein